VPECGNLVADDFGGFRRHNGADGIANLLQRASGGLGDASEVGSNGLGRGGSGLRRSFCFGGAALYGRGAP
jgi:hypothetical protein